MPRIPESLRALLANLIDYAGLYPPAALPLGGVLENYARYLASPESWMLNRLVLPAASLPAVSLGEGWRVTLLVEHDPGALPAQVEALETKTPLALSLPTYCEAPLDQLPAGAFAKLRTGGLTPQSIPSSEAIAKFLHQAAARRIPFKATAGLHHPLRSVHSLTAAPDGPRAPMHGFVNLFAAAVFAWEHAGESEIIEMLNEEEAAAFHFSENELAWRGRTMPVEAIRSARRDFAHSFGSCSFAEPVADLESLFP